MELLTPGEMARADALTIAAGTEGFALMLAAGRAVAGIAGQMAPAGPIVVVAGRGNNGGDGFVAAAELAARGREVSVILLCRRDTLKGDAARAAAAWSGPVLSYDAADPGGIGRPALIIDVLFAAGLDRPVKGDPLAMIAAMNASGAPILAVDLPSGIDGETGAVMGGAVRATATVTFFRRKPGHLLLPGRLHCGPVHLLDIGIAPTVLGDIRPAAFDNDPDLWRSQVPVPRVDGHKYGRGHAVVVSGGIASTGAARLAARGALRAGAGLVTVASPGEALAIHAAALTTIMVRPADTAADLARMLADPRLNACVVGPGAGVGAPTRALALAAIGPGRGVVLDADALTSFAPGPEVLFEAVHALDDPQVVLTPHDGEFSRLFRSLDGSAKVRSKLDLARAAAARAGAVVLIKGPDTVVAAPDGRAAIAANAPPWLATAGSGDVLAGFIAGLLAQRVPAFAAACMAVWLHGEAGREVGPGLIAEDLPEALPAVLRRLYATLGVV
ncbi:NAD(P)H-hydrate dehydratase [Bradyrhizobium sp. U87765 SZCCT0131]|uniref:NAD(P)H-hydrate dehydratase n=1 Tax=unclassified Bradyrhizobium TaxID=2631580 RepID=UPI001BAD8C0B|nr:MULTISPECIES: NAD(P)H-hydrate dehydratase [unclassified Bradyrhizobium]MBR1219987.1 NAD(P)H-hydrate dehydratase [Bradyrhizobium sp. U87765 SZCCT0131]MBR1263557.1 NAD(P)H-hydrate dehydratase [Bradyrhizobium sp. U87765 SZCCT0134]MBR1309126.1 NAD(P)H-hydrate dehydratase [Bradyrhizobium sp. U87765 SZCCT0110]MBR1323889.1 NAD(P)H-hydrate dehydratase [Bradyrhizobium sp. U87765 SZCCT0109]MBR1349441.1 NAD(P)H-hydrate dehydratase [Bradyrhizobium sp. U87765 SZCCT0048]